MITTLTQSESNPVWAFLTGECRPSEVTAFLDAVKEASDPDDDHDAQRVAFLQAALETFDSAPAAGEMTGGFAGWEALGMQWLVLGMAPGMDFLAALPTRAAAVQYLRDHDGKTFDYFAIVKARDFYALP